MAEIRTPKYRRQKSKPYPRAFVELGGKRIYLGRRGTPESREHYHRVVAEWMANGGHAKADPNAVTVAEVAFAFWKHAESLYRRTDGSPIRGSLDGYRRALSPLNRLYGTLSAVSFGPTSLRSVQQEMVRSGLARRVVNQRVNLIRAVFRWAASHEMIPATVHTALKTLEPLRQGRTQAPDHAPVRPVPEAQVQAIRPFVARQVWALVQLALLTGARAGELVQMRAIDLDMSDRIWKFTPRSHKTEYAGHDRKIYVGPQAQEVIHPFLSDRRLDAFLFSPAEAEAERRAKATAARTTPLSCGNVTGSNRVRSPAHEPGDSYDVSAFRKAISRGCDAAFPLPEALARREDESGKEWRARLTPEERAAVKRWRKEHRWNPHRLRHNAATNLRRTFGIETAKIILGHRSAGITEVYAEADQSKAVEAMRRVG